VLYDFEIASVPYFTRKNWTRIRCAHCRYVCLCPDERDAEKDFLQHFQAKHRL